MKVAARNPHGWFLLEESGRYYLDARCSRGAADYIITIELNPEERREYIAIGQIYIDYLAARIDYWPDEYLSRPVSQEIRSEIDRTIMGWLESNGMR